MLREVCHEPHAETAVASPDRAAYEPACEVPHDDVQGIALDGCIDRQPGMALGAATVLDARRARLADGEADVTGGLAVDVEVLAEAADRASSSGDVRGHGGQKQVESRGHAGYIPAAPCANPEPLDRVHTRRGRAWR